MTTFPCSKPPSLCDQEVNPLTSYSSEAPAEPTFVGLAWAAQKPRLGKSFTVYPCEAIEESQISQADADLAAARSAVLCANPCSPIFSSNSQTATGKCSDGDSYFYTVTAGTFLATNQELADRMAFTYAAKQLSGHSLCLAALSSGVICLGSFFSAEILAVGTDAPFTFQLTAGTLPPGITMVGESTAAFLSGTPTTLGVYAFTIRATSSFGTYTEHSYSLMVSTITTANNFPDGYNNTAYSQQLNVFNPEGMAVMWSVVSGSLPGGLSLDPSTGLISGTVSGGGTFNFTVEALLGGAGCTASYTIKTWFINFDLLVWSNINNHLGNGTLTAIYNGSFISFQASNPDASNTFSFALGTMTYTGPAVNCKVTVTVIGTNVSSQGFAIFQDGVTKLTVNSLSGQLPSVGTFVFNFSLIAGTNSIIQIKGIQNESPTGGQFIDQNNNAVAGYSCVFHQA